MTRRLLDGNPKREAARQQRILLVAERRFTEQFRRVIADALRSMADQYERTGAAPDLPPAHEREVEAAFYDLSEAVTTAFAERVLDQGKALGFQLDRKEGFAELFQRIAIDWIASEAVRRRITSVAETTRKDIVDAVARGQRDGLGVSEIATGLRKSIPGMSQQRGALIARTETHGAANNGTNEAAKATGLKLKKEWVSVGDDRTRSDHAELDGVVVDQDQPFNVGGSYGMFPGDPALPADQSINCRCVISHIVDDGF